MGEVTTARGSAQVQGRLWNAHPHDWAEIEDEGARGLFEAVIGVAGVGRGTRLLDVGCGSGLACALAAQRGAEVAGLDAASKLLEIASERVPSGDFRVGDMQELPYDDGSFDVVMFINSYFFAADPHAPLAEAARVTRTGGTVAVVVWTEPEHVALSAYLAALAPLMPSSFRPPEVFIHAGELERRASRAGLEPREVVELEWSWAYPDLATAQRGLLSAGPSTLAIETSGEHAVRDALTAALEPFRERDGGYRLENVCRCLLAGALTRTGAAGPDPGRYPALQPLP
jgi:SAM-dependent methyltransferase